MTYGVAGKAVMSQPVGGSTVTVAWITAGLQTQPFGEQMVVAEPASPVVERDDEQIEAVELLEDVLGLLDARHGVAQRRGQPVEDRGVEQESSDPVGKPGQNLVSEVVGHVAVVTGELVDEGTAVGMIAKRQADELYPYGPPFGPLGETSQLGPRQPDRHLFIEQGGDVAVVETQVVEADLP